MTVHERSLTDRSQDMSLTISAPYGAGRAFTVSVIVTGRLAPPLALVATAERVRSGRPGAR
jgi:hypothetical protein